MCVGGEGVARGYLNKPDLTAERFVPHPFSSEEGRRLYRTGDLGRYLPDGRIEYLGRADQQVKIRGFRIEPGEIETQLRVHPSIKDVAVEAREDGRAEKRLVAYLVEKSQNGLGNEELRSYLGEKLPEYMIPSAFVRLEGLPVTSNGKLDRAALPAPSEETLIADLEITPPGNPLEELLANVWAEMLDHQSVGVHNNFFHLGGHSLLAAQIVLRLRELFDLEIPLRALFENPTVAELARWLQSALREQSRSPVAPIKSVSRNQNLPLSFAQQRLWFLDQLQPGSPSYNIPA